MYTNINPLPHFCMPWRTHICMCMIDSRQIAEALCKWTNMHLGGIWIGIPAIRFSCLITSTAEATLQPWQYVSGHHSEEHQRLQRTADNRRNLCECWRLSFFEAMYRPGLCTEHIRLPYQNQSIGPSKSNSIPPNLIVALQGLIRQRHITPTSAIWGPLITNSGDWIMDFCMNSSTELWSFHVF